MAEYRKKKAEQKPQRRSAIPGPKSRFFGRTRLKYGAGILALSALVLSSLYLPQVFFAVQDTIQYKGISLMKQEQMDILSLSTGYEASLYRRMANFAEGRAGERRYYVDEQEKEVTEEIWNFLRSDEGLNQSLLRGFMELIQPPKDYLRGISQILQWKQYLIYSDDYAQGVNFILWFFELEVSEGYRTLVLMDAQDYTVYAVRLYNTNSQGQTSKSMTDGVSVSLLSDSTMIMETWTEPSLDMWMALNVEYGVLRAETAMAVYEIHKDIYQINSKKGVVQSQQVDFLDTDGNSLEIWMWPDRNTALARANGEPLYGEYGDGTKYYLLPLGENQLTCTLQLLTGGSAFSFTAGVQEIYELIPEFQSFG